MSRNDAGGNDYFVDAHSGDDWNSGHSAATAWRTLRRVSAHRFGPGDRILLRSGCSWRGQLHPKGSGAPDRPIVVGRYGGDAYPRIDGAGKAVAAVKLENQQYWELHDLEITNAAPIGQQPTLARGVEIGATDIGPVRHIRLKNLFVHDVTGPPPTNNDADVARKAYGGIITLIEGDLIPTYFDGLVVEHCRVQDVNANGMSMHSSWTSGHRDLDAAHWQPSYDVVIRRNLFERTARNGLIVRACVKPLVEYNRFLRCAVLGSGNACFPFHCEDALFQYNESAWTHYNPNDHDASGFDADWNCRRTIFQHNYSHHNDYGFMVLCNYGKVGFNEGTIVRHNLSVHDHGNIFRIAGRVRGARIHDNTIVVAPDMRNPKGEAPCIVRHTYWGGWSDDITFANNRIYNHSPHAEYVFGESTNNRYEGNLFFGFHPANEPHDAAAHRLSGSRSQKSGV